MKNSPLFLSILASASILITGCAATPSVQRGAIQGDLSQYRSVRVIVAAPEPIRAQTGYDVASAELSREFLVNVLATGRHATTGSEPLTGKSLEALLTITGFNYVSGAARGQVGILAGRAVLNVTMTIKDIETGATVGTVSAAHASSHAQGVFSPVTSTQITAIAKELSAVLDGK
jgi:hypothetical protein